MKDSITGTGSLELTAYDHGFPVRGENKNEDWVCFVFWDQNAMVGNVSVGNGNIETVNVRFGTNW